MKFSVPEIQHFDAEVQGKTQIIYHGVNKSGSLALSKVLTDAFEICGRADEVFSHYSLGGGTEKYLRNVEERDQPGLYIGHYLYGALKPKPNRIFVSQFRHPLPRVLSCYSWLKRRHEASGRTAPYPELDTWVKQTKGIAHSQIAQFGVGFGPDRHRPNRQARSSEEVFDAAIEALERDVFAFGIAEYFEETIFLMASICGLPTVRPWVNDNRNPGRRMWYELPEASKELIEDVYRHDFFCMITPWSVLRKKFPNWILGTTFNCTNTPATTDTKIA